MRCLRRIIVVVDPPPFRTDLLSAFVFFNLIQRIDKGSRCHGTTHDVVFVGDFHELPRVQSVRGVDRSGEPGVAFIFNVRVTGFAFLRCDKDNSIRCPHTINGRRGVLQCGYTFDLVGVKSLHVVTRDTVNDDKRLTQTSYVDRGRKRAWFSGSLHHTDSSHFSRKHIHDILAPGLFQRL